MDKAQILNFDSLKKALNEDYKATLAKVYDNYKLVFINFAKKYDIDKDIVLDIYQDSVIDMYQNIVIKQVEIKHNIDIKTYLFSIGKYKIFNELKRRKKMILVDDFHFENTSEFDDNIGLTTEQEQLKKGYALLGEKCKKILQLFYYRGFSIKDIVLHTDYKDENTVKSYKSRCMKTLKQNIF